MIWILGIKNANKSSFETINQQKMLGLLELKDADAGTQAPRHPKDAEKFSLTPFLRWFNFINVGKTIINHPPVLTIFIGGYKML